MIEIWRANVHAMCDGYGCRKVAAWCVGVAKVGYFVANLCDDCMRSIAADIAGISDSEEQQKSAGDFEVYGEASTA